jgi:hypothetical protein
VSSRVWTTQGEHTLHIQLKIALPANTSAPRPRCAATLSAAIPRLDTTHTHTYTRARQETLTSTVRIAATPPHPGLLDPPHSQVGYLPRELAALLAPLMDTGTLFVTAAAAPKSDPRTEDFASGYCIPLDINVYGCSAAAQEAWCALQHELQVRGLPSALMPAWPRWHGPAEQAQAVAHVR